MIIFASLTSGLIIGGLLGFAICIILVAGNDDKGDYR